MVFDNGIRSARSRLLEVDPLALRIVWRFQGDPPASFYSSEMGAAQQLPNGNVLVTESEKGRVFEITREGEVVWDFFVPDVDRRRRRRKTLYRMTRLGTDVVDRLLAR
jgi:hypothetical protein